MIVHLAVPLAAIPFADLDDDDVFVPVIHVEHPEDELGDGEVIDDIAILVLPSPVISVVDISSSSSAAESEQLSDDASSAAPVPPLPIHSPLAVPSAPVDPFPTVRPPCMYTPIPPPGMDPFDPYHPSHFPPTTMEDMTMSHDVQISILFRRLAELQPELAAVRAAITPPPPPASLLPPLPSSPPPSPPSLPQ
ncbi:pollen-specific leucine-rich repeat extensin-like protein 4 [Helianthus annuus]|uniref:pollen-specific leucine-rich repeat extensin-like protein 4 n=1 Tax=Helianthus annuus TaxID=4232 RepID=UPI000B8F3CC5|nr:pollen-specific leucine-rich repeat extensin-like protein 4 [Helianthus annuus]